MSVFMKTMAAKNPIAALRKEGSPLYDKIDRQNRRAARRARKGKGTGLHSTKNKSNCKNGVCFKF
jgi:hypothetical protein